MGHYDEQRDYEDRLGMDRAQIASSAGVSLASRDSTASAQILEQLKQTIAAANTINANLDATVCRLLGERVEETAAGLSARAAPGSACSRSRSGASCPP